MSTATAPTKTRTQNQTRIIVLDDLAEEGLALLDTASDIEYDVRIGLKGEELDFKKALGSIEFKLGWNLQATMNFPSMYEVANGVCGSLHLHNCLLNNLPHEIETMVYCLRTRSDGFEELGSTCICTNA